MSLITSTKITGTGYKPLEKLGPKVTAEVYRLDFDVVEFPLKKFKPKADWCILSPVVPKEKTSGGIILTDKSREVDEYISQIGRIEAVGSLFYKLKPWSEDPEPPQVGQFVLIKPYVSQRFTLSGHKFLMTPQNAIVSVLDPEEVASLDLNLQIFT